MDFSKLSSSEKMSVYASVAVIVLAIYALAYRWGGLMALPLLGGVGVLAVVFLPQMSPNTKLPGSTGSLLVISGAVVVLFWALTTLVELGYIFRNLTEVDTWIFIVGLAAALWLGWQTWKAFQAEGGKLQIGAAAAPSAPAAPPAAPPPAAPPAAPPPAAPPAAPPPAESGSDGDETTG